MYILIHTDLTTAVTCRKEHTCMQQSNTYGVFHGLLIIIKENRLRDKINQSIILRTHTYTHEHSTTRKYNYVDMK